MTGNRVLRKAEVLERLDPVSGQQGEADRTHRRSGAREDHRRHLRSARRIRPRRHAHRRRVEARRDAGGRAEQSLQAHPAAIELRHHHAGDRRRPAEGAEPARAHRELRRVPPRGRPPPHRVRAAQGRGAVPHPRRAEDRPRSSRCGDHADSRVEDRRRGPRRPDDDLRPVTDSVAGDSRHAAAAPDRPRAAEDSRRARRAAEDDRAAARDSRAASAC